MNGISLDAVLVARTVPELDSNGDEHVCSVWWNPHLAAGGLFRVYPLDRAWRMKQWATYELWLTHSNKDSRWRSFKLVDKDTPPPMKAATKREDTIPAMAEVAGRTTIKQLNGNRDSLGLIKPSEMSWSFDETEPDGRDFGRRSFPYAPRLTFRDGDGSHSLQYNEWGAFEFLRKYVVTGEKPRDELWQAMRLGRDDSDSMLVVGNLRDRRNAWIVISHITWSVSSPTLFGGDHGRVPASTRAAVFERDGYRCCWCGTADSLTIDHVIPTARGGSDDESNLRALCLSCNSRKGDRLDEELPLGMTA